MKERITGIISEVKTKISAASSEGELQNVKSAYISKQGALSLLLKELPKLDPALRPEMGKLLNQAKDQVKELIDAKKLELTLKASEVSPDFDCSVPGIMPRQGGLHPITQMCYDLNDTFRSMGFEIFQEDDITSELYAFDKLNFPQNHPARESMDTYWLEGHDSGKIVGHELQLAASRFTPADADPQTAISFRISGTRLSKRDYRCPPRQSIFPVRGADCG